MRIHGMWKHFRRSLFCRSGGSGKRSRCLVFGGPASRLSMRFGGVRASKAEQQYHCKGVFCLGLFVPYFSISLFKWSLTFATRSSRKHTKCMKDNRNGSFDMATPYLTQALIRALCFWRTVSFFSIGSFITLWTSNCKRWEGSMMGRKCRSWKALQCLDQSDS